MCVAVTTAPASALCETIPSAAMSGTERCTNFHACGKTVAGGPGTGLCAACRCVAYCSRECQAADWPAHKVTCKESRKRDTVLRSTPPRAAGALPLTIASTLAAAQAGDPIAQFNVATVYASGTAGGVTQSCQWSSAFAWYKRCAAHASPPCAVWAALGACYEFGRGVAVDEVEAVRLYRVGAALGDATARVQLAECLARGIGVPMADRDAAFALFAAAAAQDLPEALCALGRCYCFGAGVARDVPRAVTLYNRALAHTHVSSSIAAGAAFNLGVAYWNDEDGVVRDAELAARYWRQAAALGHERAVRVLRENGL